VDRLTRGSVLVQSLLFDVVVYSVCVCKWKEEKMMEQQLMDDLVITYAMSLVTKGDDDVRRHAFIWYLS